MKKILFTSFLLFLISSNIYSQNNCEKLRHCKLKYLSGDDLTAYIIIDGKEHTEVMNDGKFYIKSDISWTSDCEFEMTITKLYYPDFPFKPGEKMYVKVDKIENEVIFMTGTVQGKSYNSKYRMIK